MKKLILIFLALFCSLERSNGQEVKINSDSLFEYCQNFVFVEDEKAIVCFNKLLELDPNNKEAYYWRGNAYWQVSEYNSALNDYNKAILLNPKKAEYYSGRANVQGVFLGNYKEAISDYSKAIKLEKNDGSFYESRADVYGKRKKYRKAIKDYTTAIDLLVNVDTTMTNPIHKKASLLYDRAEMYEKVSMYSMFQFLKF